MRWPLKFFTLPDRLGVWAAEGVEAKSGPSADSFYRICSPIAVAMGQKAGEKWTAAVALQPTFLLPPKLLAHCQWTLATLSTART